MGSTSRFMSGISLGYYFLFKSSVKNKREADQLFLAGREGRRGVPTVWPGQTWPPLLALSTNNCLHIKLSFPRLVPPCQATAYYRCQPCTVMVTARRVLHREDNESLLTESQDCESVQTSLMSWMEGNTFSLVSNWRLRWCRTYNTSIHILLKEGRR